MKHHTAVAVAIAASLTLGACASLKNNEPPPIRINYEAANGDATGLIRVFDMKGHTVLQFFDVSKARPTIYGDSAQAPLDFDVVGQQMAVLPGTFQSLRIEANHSTATVTRQVDAQERNIDSTAARPALEASNTTAPAEVAAIQTKPDRPEQPAVDLGKVILRVSFGFNSASFDPPLTTKTKLLVDANAASLINVRGRTDSPIANDTNFRIALARAISARDYLIKNGVDGSKIRIFSLAAGAFITKTDTEQGRRMNRRVEIEMLGKDAARLALLDANRR